MKFFPFFCAMIILVSVAQGESTIDTQIDQIMKAPANERYELMNQLKTNIATMNETMLPINKRVILSDVMIL